VLRAQVVARERVSVSAAPVVDEAREMTLGRGGASAGAQLETPRPLAQARETRAQAGEMHAGDSGRASENLHARTPLPLAPSPAAPERAEPERRRHDDAPAVTRASSPGVAETFTPGRAAAGTRAAELNVQRLTEQVSRHLARRLLIERERRGLGRR
jgi:hypothetical protein